MFVDPIIVELIDKISLKKKAYLTGGYLRDQYMNETPMDIDIVTNMSLKDIEEMFGQVYGSEKGIEFGVCRVMFKNKQFEISNHNLFSLYEDYLERDYTFNAMYFDGRDIIDYSSCEQDAKEGILRPTNHCLKDIQLVRGIRVVSEKNAVVEKDIEEFLKESYLRTGVGGINQNRLSHEGARIIRGKNAKYAIQLMINIGMIKGDVKGLKVENRGVPDPKFVLMDIVDTFGEESVVDLMGLWGSSVKKVREAAERVRYYDFVDIDEIDDAEAPLYFQWWKWRWRFEEDKRRWLIKEMKKRRA